MEQNVEFAPDQHRTEDETIHVLWATTGLGCDGDTLAITSATSPSLEDILLGTIPGTPRVILHNPVLAYEQGDDFLQAWHDAEHGDLDPYVLVVEGSIGNEEINGEGHWTGMGVGLRRSADHDQRVGRPARAARRRGDRGRYLRHLRRDPGDEKQPDRGDGAA